MDEVIRREIPRDQIGMFVAMVQSLAVMSKIDKIPDIQHHVDLLVRAAGDYAFGLKEGSVASRAADEKKRFIAIFKTRFIAERDYEYPHKTVSPVELKIIGDFISMKLATKGIDSDTYLEWFFESFLVKKPNFNPASLKLACSNMCWGEFLYESSEILKEKKEKSMQADEQIVFVNRARECMRRCVANNNEELREKIKTSVTKFRDGDIMFSEFKKLVNEFEKLSKS
jgi:hypothetical protein